MNSELSAAAAYSLDYARELISGKNILVLTGAGISTDSGIPDYRGEGRVARHPMTFDSFVGSPAAQARYWSRSYVGWSRISQAKPNAGHIALAKFERAGKLTHIITQNVDGLHQAAGSMKVVDLHGRLDRVKCLSCSLIMTRGEMDQLLKRANPLVRKDLSVEFSPDGDAEVENSENFVVPNCPNCQGVLKPDVVFFGENVPVDRAEFAISQLSLADALLVAGTSLTVNSGLRFVRAASKANMPVVILNIGPTKGDALASAKIEANTSLSLERLLID